MKDVNWNYVQYFGFFFQVIMNINQQKMKSIDYFYSWCKIDCTFRTFEKVQNFIYHQCIWQQEMIWVHLVGGD